MAPRKGYFVEVYQPQLNGTEESIHDFIVLFIQTYYA